MYQRGYGDIALMEGKLEEARERFQRYFQISKSDRPPHSWGLAYAQAKLGLISAVQGEPEKAQEMICNAVKAAQIWFSLEIGLLALFSQATLFAASGEMERAVELSTFIIQHPASWNETKQQAKVLLEAASRELPENVTRAAQKRGEILEFDSAIAVIMGGS